MTEACIGNGRLALPGRPSATGSRPAAGRPTARRAGTATAPSSGGKDLRTRPAEGVAEAARRQAPLHGVPVCGPARRRTRRTARGFVGRRPRTRTRQPGSFGGPQHPRRPRTGSDRGGPRPGEGAPDLRPDEQLPANDLRLRLTAHPRSPPANRPWQDEAARRPPGPSCLQSPGTASFRPEPGTGRRTRPETTGRSQASPMPPPFEWRHRPGSRPGRLLRGAGRMRPGGRQGPHSAAREEGIPNECSHIGSTRTTRRFPPGSGRPGQGTGRGSGPLRRWRCRQQRLRPGAPRPCRRPHRPFGPPRSTPGPPPGTTGCTSGDRRTRWTRPELPSRRKRPGRGAELPLPIPDSKLQIANPETWLGSGSTWPRLYTAPPGVTRGHAPSTSGAFPCMCRAFRG